MTARQKYLLMTILVWLIPTYQEGNSGTSTVVMTHGPKDGASINDSNFRVYFEARSITSKSMLCRLDRDGRVDRNWETCVSPHLIQLHVDGQYKFQVMADQGLENDNPVVEWNWILDRVPPNTTIQDPPPDARPGAHFQFTGHDERSPISHYECKMDEDEWRRCTSPYPLPPLSPGWHFFRVKAFDAAQNVDTEPAQRMWRVNSDPSPATIEPASLPESEPGSAGISSSWRALAGEPSSESDSRDEDVLDRVKANWLMSVLILVCALIGLFFLSFGAYKCCISIKQRAFDQDGDGGGSQLTSLESEVLSGGIDLSGFSSIMAASWPEHIRRFSYQELWVATAGFPEKGILGEGGFGKVYSGILEDGTPVAVKELEKSGQQGDREFFVEVATLCRARHLNILRLVGVCMENSNRVCVFELMDWGSARSLLDDADSRLTWEARVKIATGAARGLACLHESIDPPVVHRDLKSENILMDHHGEARISDFGLCILAHHEARQRHLRRNVTITVGTICGTFGYLAPEIIGSGRVSTKSDVFAFGVFLLELLTGRRPIETARPSHEQDLVKWMFRHIDRMDRIFEAVDPLISCDVSFVETTAFVELAAACLDVSPSNRPTASEAARRLEELMSFRQHPAQSRKKNKDKMGELCLAPRLSETSGTIPTGFRISCPSEGELTPHAVVTPLASTSSGLITDVELAQRRFRDSSSELPSPQEIFAMEHKDQDENPTPSSTLDGSP